MSSAFDICLQRILLCVIRLAGWLKHCNLSLSLLGRQLAWLGPAGSSRAAAEQLHLLVSCLDVTESEQLHALYVKQRPMISSYVLELSTYAYMGRCAINGDCLVWLSSNSSPQTVSQRFLLHMQAGRKWGSRMPSPLR